MVTETKERTLSIWEFFQRFPDEESATKWFEKMRWPDEMYCPHCGVVGNVAKVKNAKPMPWRCRECRRHFSVRTKSVLAESPLPLQKWLMAAYLMSASRKGISSTQLAKHLGVRQATAWFLEHRIREAYAKMGGLLGPEVELDEVYIGGKERNKHKDKRNDGQGRGPVGKQAVLGMVERGGDVRAFPISATDKIHLHAAIVENIKRGSVLYTDGHKAYQGLRGYEHESVEHGEGEYVRGRAHTNSVESFWALLKRGYYGVFHYMSVKHLHRYVSEFCGRQNMGHDTMTCLEAIALGMLGRRLTYKRLTQ